jgi:hypothetical protein
VLVIEREAEHTMDSIIIAFAMFHKKKKGQKSIPSVTAASSLAATSSISPLTMDKLLYKVESSITVWIWASFQLNSIPFENLQVHTNINSDAVICLCIQLLIAGRTLLTEKM